MILSLFRTIFVPAQRCFNLAAAGRSDEALALLRRVRANMSGNRFWQGDVELQLLEAFLTFDRGDATSWKVLEKVFLRIRRSNAYNADEKAVLKRYALHLIWNARHSPNRSCLPSLIDAQRIDSSKVRGRLLQNFPVVPVPTRLAER